MIIYVLQIVSALVVITYYSISMYITIHQDTVNTRVVRYAWYHIRDKWKRQIKEKYKTMRDYFFPVSLDINEFATIVDNDDDEYVMV